MNLLQPSLESYWTALNSAEGRVMQTLEGSGVMGPSKDFGRVAAPVATSATPQPPITPYRRPGLN